MMTQDELLALIYEFFLGKPPLSFETWEQDDRLAQACDGQEPKTIATLNELTGLTLADVRQLFQKRLLFLQHDRILM